MAEDEGFLEGAAFGIEALGLGEDGGGRDWRR
jgi:hypothetical protein